MRTLTGAESAALSAPNKWVSYLAEIQNGDGTFIDLTSLSGLNFCEGASFSGGDVDQPIANATIRLRRDSGNLSLAPFMEGSTLNRLDDGMTYAPLLDAGRRIRLSLAVTAHGVEPVAGDFQLLFDGFTDGVEFGSSTVNVFCRDLGALLVDTQIDTLRTYGSDAGVAIEAVMQAILDDNLGASAPTLFVPTSPLFLISPAFEQQRESVWDALTALIQLIGWRLSYEWDDGTSSFRLTFVEPDRTKTTPDWTFSPSEYVDISHLSIDRDDVRTRVRVTFIDSATGEEDFVEDTNPETFARYGDRLLHIIEGSGSPIDTLSEATALMQSVLADVSNPIADQEVETIFFWPAQVGDLLRFAPNGVHYDVAQDYAVASIRHELSINSHRTFLRVQGKPSGGFLTWLQRSQQFPGDDLDIIPEVFSLNALFSPDALTEVQVGVDDDVRADGVNPSGYISIGINAPPADPTAIDNDGTYIVAAATRTGVVDTNVEVDSDDVAYVKAVALGDDGSPGPVAGPFKFLSPGFHAWNRTYLDVFDADAGGAQAIVFRDGTNINTTTLSTDVFLYLTAINITTGSAGFPVRAYVDDVSGNMTVELLAGGTAPGGTLNNPNITVSGTGLIVNIPDLTMATAEDVQIRTHTVLKDAAPRRRVSLGEPRYQPDLLATSGNFLDAGGQVFNVRHPDFGGVGDGVTDDTVALQNLINAAAQANGTAYIGPGIWNFTQLFLQHHATLNPGFPSSISKRGRYAIVGAGGVNQVQNLLFQGTQCGTVLNCTSSTGIPIVANEEVEDGNNFPHRGTRIENLTVIANTPEFVMRVQGGQSWIYRNLRIANNNTAGSGLQITDGDQVTLEDIAIVGASAYLPGTRGLFLENIDIDSSGNNLDNMIVRNFEIAYQIGALPTTGTFIRSSRFGLLRCRDVDVGALIADRLETNVFELCQFRGFVYGARFFGRQNATTCIGTIFAEQGSSAIANVEIGDPLGTGGQNLIHGILFDGCLFQQISNTGILQHSLGDIDQIRVEGCRFFMNAGATVINYDGDPKGGTFVNNDIGGSSVITVYGGVHPSFGLDKWTDYTTTEPLVMHREQLAGVAGDSTFIQWLVGDFLRWQLGRNATAEGGGNAGSLFQIQRFDDSGGFLGVALAIRRDSGDVTVQESIELDQQNLEFGAPNVIRYQANALNRWDIGRDNDDETPGVPVANDGSSFIIRRYDDSGVLLGTSVHIARTTGDVTFEGRIILENAGLLDALILNAPASQSSRFEWRVGGLRRWNLGKDADGEVGSNTGSNFDINRFDDAGNALGTALTIQRSNGVVSFPGTANSGTSTVLSGTMDVIISHGLDVTPALHDIQVTPINSMGAATKFWVTSPTATEFTINVDVDPGATGASFAWRVHVL